VSLVDELKWDDKGLIPLIVQDRNSKDVLMVGWANREALEKTIATSMATFWSRSRNTLWTKGESSGNAMMVHELLFDCDLDTIIALVEPKGAACHEGYRSCFFRRLTPISAEGTLAVFGEREFDPKDVYGKDAGKKG
jgi:phosphoribosyl-AMP cyclohydrolase